MNEFKKMIEKRNEKLLEMDNILDKAGKETRALNDEEKQTYEKLEKEIRALSDTITKMKERKNEEFDGLLEEDKQKELRAINEEKSFRSYLKGDTRALTESENGGIIPKTIASQIIQKVFEISPLYAKATTYNIKGELVIPLDDDGDIDVAVVDEFQELTEKTSTFKTVTLKNNITGALSKVSRSLINNTEFDIVSYVVNSLAKKYARFFEKIGIKGYKKEDSTEIMKGLESSTSIVHFSTDKSATADELIDMQMTLPTAYSQNACWIMKKETFANIRKLKDKNGQYLVGNITDGSGYTLLGKPVYPSDNADDFGAGKTPVFYGDMQGLAYKFSSAMEITVLNEKFSTQYAKGVVAYAEVDCKVIDDSKIIAGRCPDGSDA